MQGWSPSQEPSEDLGAVPPQYPTSYWNELFTNSNSVPHIAGDGLAGASHAVGGQDEACPRGSLGGSVQSEELTPNWHNNFQQASTEFRMPPTRYGVSQDPVASKPSNPCAQDVVRQDRGQIAVRNDQQCDPAPGMTRSRRRMRDNDWTDEETELLVECKVEAFHDKASPFRKGKSIATNWDAISHKMRDNLVTSASEKTGDQCRLRWDTMVKSHRIVKKQCVEKIKGYADFTNEEKMELRLPTTLALGWYEVIDTIKSRSVVRSQKLDKQRFGVGNLEILEGRVANVLHDPVVRSGNAVTDPDSHLLVVDQAPAVSTRDFQPSSPGTQIPTGSPERRNSSRKQIPIPGFSSMHVQLRATLLDLILGASFIEGRWREEEDCLSFSCRWLSIVQNRSCSEIYDDVTILVNMKLLHISVDASDFNLGAIINWSSIRGFDKFVKKVILRNLVYDTHLRIGRGQPMSTLDASSVPQRIRVLHLAACEELEEANFRGLRNLRSLCISDCQKLVKVTGWKFLRELGWLVIDYCPAYEEYPDLQDLPSLREFRFYPRDFRRQGLSSRHGFDISPCVRLRRLEIFFDETLTGSGDLSPLKCLETLTFRCCTALSTISDLSGLHLLTSLELDGCNSMQTLPDIGHMKELVHLDVCSTGLEEIPGVEKLVSLKTLHCSNSKLKRLTDLHHLRQLRWVFLKGTPLIEDDPSSFYFDKEEVAFNNMESRYVEVSNISITECNLLDTNTGASVDYSLSSDEADRVF